MRSNVAEKRAPEMLCVPGSADSTIFTYIEEKKREGREKGLCYDVSNAQPLRNGWRSERLHEGAAL